MRLSFPVKYEKMAMTQWCRGGGLWMCSDITSVSLPACADVILSEFNRVKQVFISDEQELQL